MKFVIVLKILIKWVIEVKVDFNQFILYLKKIQIYLICCFYGSNNALNKTDIKKI